MVGSLIITNTSDDRYMVYSGISTNLIGSFNYLKFSDSAITTDNNRNLLNTEYVAGDVGSHLYIHSGISNIVTGSFMLNLPAAFTRGITVLGGSLYATNVDIPYIYKYSGISNIVTGSFLDSTGNYSMSSFGSSLYTLYVSGDNLKIVKKYDTDGNILGSQILTEISDSLNAGITFDDNGNLIMLADGDTTSVENWVLYKYDGFSSNCTGSLVFGDTNGLTFLDVHYLVPEEEGGSTEINLTDSFSVNDTLSKSIKINKSFLDSFSTDDNLSIQDISNVYTINIQEEFIIDDGEQITKKVILNKNILENINITDSFSQSKKQLANRTFVRINII